MQQASILSVRHQLAESTARFHVVDRSLRLHVSRWTQQSAGLVSIIDDYWARERLVPSAQMIPESIRANGEAALARCNEAHARREDLLAARHRCLCDVLTAIGAYYADQMAGDHQGSLLTRFMRYLHKALAERELNVDGVRVRFRMLDPLDALREFPLMMAPWAKALGYRTPSRLLADLELERDMRGGSVPADLDVSIRLGITH